jgi:hypothetical protein
VTLATIEDRMRTFLRLLFVVAAIVMLTGCVYRTGDPDRYEASNGYYDGYYGPYGGGYWADDGYFYYADDRHIYHRDDSHHFRRERFEGGDPIHAGHRDDSDRDDSRESDERGETRH